MRKVVRGIETKRLVFSDTNGDAYVTIKGLQHSDATTFLQMFNSAKRFLDKSVKLNETENATDAATLTSSAIAAVEVNTEADKAYGDANLFLIKSGVVSIDGFITKDANGVEVPVAVSQYDDWMSSLTESEIQSIWTEITALTFPDKEEKKTS